jgi:hypothetical protein
LVVAIPTELSRFSSAIKEEKVVKEYRLGCDALQSGKFALLDIYVLAYSSILMMESVYSSQTSDNFYQNTHPKEQQPVCTEGKLSELKDSKRCGGGFPITLQY